MKKIATISCIVFLIISAFSADKTSWGLSPEGWPAPNYDFTKNPPDENKIQLGRALFYDPILSRNNTISCASCHSQYTAFAHVDHALSHGIEDRIGKRNAPSLINLAWNKSFMWDGAINHLDMQSLAPINHPDEMDEKTEHLIQKLQNSKLYPSLFYLAYKDSTITGEHMLKAIAQFMLTLVSCNAKYDSVMRKQANFSIQEAKGYALFRKHCSNCHSEPLFTNSAFENNGLRLDTFLKDYGRVMISQNPEDSFKFKVPSLRNVEFSYPYMHDGRFKSLSKVMDHYTGGIVRHKNLSPKLQAPIKLSSNEKVDIIAFLLTLTDKSFLFDPQYSFPKKNFVKACEGIIK